jgi:Trk K+ transport system NAD-binding subunit
MHIVIAGYGRVGRSIAREFEERGHSIAVIDRSDAVYETTDGLKGRKLTGEAFDRETLLRAGIEKAGCFCATTSGDNSNFVSARVARDHFHVPQVLARIKEPRRAEIYRTAGIDTISPVEWATNQFLDKVPGDITTTHISPLPPVPPRPRQAVRAVRDEPAGDPILIVGGGKAGTYLADRLRANHLVVIVEQRADRAEYLRHAMPEIEVVHGDGCEPATLERAGVSEMKFVTAATGDDEDNLVVGYLAKHIGTSATVIARINHPYNEWLFTPDWGVDEPVGAASGLYRAVSKRCDVFNAPEPPAQS